MVAPTLGLWQEPTTSFTIRQMSPVMVMKISDCYMSVVKWYVFGCETVVVKGGKEIILQRQNREIKGK